MMYGDGKSHSLIVPVKPPNETEPEAKEAVEERGLAKGKTLKRNRFRTQSRQILSNTLERIRKGKEGSEHRYHSYSSATSASRPKARTGCGNSARPDPCGGSPARAIPTATLRLTTSGRISLKFKHLSVRPEHGRRAPKEFSHSLSLSMTPVVLCELRHNRYL